MPDTTTTIEVPSSPLCEINDQYPCPTVPEASPLALLLIGGLMLAFLRGRK